MSSRRARGLGYTQVADDETAHATAQHFKKVKDADGDDYFYTQRWQKGSKWSGSRSGNRSLFDQAQRDDQALSYKARHTAQGHSTPGIYNIRIMSENGRDAIPNADYSVGGDTYKADANGNLRCVDAEFLNLEIEAAQRQAEWEDAVMRSCLISNEMARLVLGPIAYPQLKKGVKVLGAPAGNDVDGQNALPDDIRYMDGSSHKYSLALAKLKAIIHLNGDIIVDQSAAKLKTFGGDMGNIKKKSSAADVPSTQGGVGGAGGGGD